MLATITNVRKSLLSYILLAKNFQEDLIELRVLCSYLISIYRNLLIVNADFEWLLDLHFK